LGWMAPSHSTLRPSISTQSRRAASSRPITWRTGGLPPISFGSIRPFDLLTRVLLGISSTFSPFLIPSRNLSRELVLSLYDKCFTVNSRSDPDQVADRLLHDDFIAFGPPNKSKPEFIAQLQQFWKLVPDLRCEVQEMIAEGNKVAVFTFASGSPRGDFLGLVGLDGSKSFHITAIDIHTIEEGRIKSTHHLGDWGLAAEQLNWEISFDPRESNNIFYRPTTGFTQDRYLSSHLCVSSLV
jgi:predicted ester cyclase